MTPGLKSWLGWLDSEAFSEASLVVLLLGRTSYLAEDMMRCGITSPTKWVTDYRHHNSGF